MTARGQGALTGGKTAYLSFIRDGLEQPARVLSLFLTPYLPAWPEGFFLAGGRLCIAIEYTDADLKTILTRMKRVAVISVSDNPVRALFCGAVSIAEARGVDVVQNRCPKIDYQRLFGELRMGGFAAGVISNKL